MGLLPLASLIWSIVGFSSSKVWQILKPFGLWAARCSAEPLSLPVAYCVRLSATRIWTISMTPEVAAISSAVHPSRPLVLGLHCLNYYNLGVRLTSFTRETGRFRCCHTRTPHASSLTGLFRVIPSRCQAFVLLTPPLGSATFRFCRSGCASLRSQGRWHRFWSRSEACRLVFASVLLSIMSTGTKFKQKCFNLVLCRFAVSIWD